MNSTVVIKQRSQLLPLSREHRDGLLFVSRLRQGLSKHTDIFKLNKYVKWFAKWHISPHFFQEEKILLPYIPADHKIRDILEDDHSEIIELMRAIDMESDRHDINFLAARIESHIQWEENVFFEYLEENLPVESLENILDNLEKYPVRSEADWEDTFWED